MKKLEWMILSLTMAGLIFTGCSKRESYAGEWKDRCGLNLKGLESAKKQWALETGGRPENTPSMEALKYYLKMYFKDGVFPTCPAGGHYSLNSVAEKTTCSIPSHKLESEK